MCIVTQASASIIIRSAIVHDYLSSDHHVELFNYVGTMVYFFQENAHAENSSCVTQQKGYGLLLSRPKNEWARKVDGFFLFGTVFWHR